MTDSVGRDSDTPTSQLKNAKTRKRGTIALNFPTGTYGRSTSDTGSENDEDGD
jgi:hypothetical protein